MSLQLDIFCGGNVQNRENLVVVMVVVAAVGCFVCFAVVFRTIASVLARC